MNEDLVQMPLHIDANRHAKKSVKRKEELSEDLVQVKVPAADQQMWRRRGANRHAKKSAKKRELVGVGLVRVKELEGDPMKAIYNVGHRSTRTVPLRRSRRTT